MKKLLSLLLAVSILFGNVAVNVLAEDTQGVTATDVMHNIAEKYASEGMSNDANMLWLLPDMATYQKLFPDTENVVSDEEKQICLDKIINSVKDSNAPATLAKGIIALRSLGYDAREIYTKNGEQIDIVTRLTDLVDAENSGVTSVYTLPYVIIALQQGTGYATDNQMEYLVDTLMSKKASWQNTMWGPDTATPVILALSPYYEDVKSEIDETVTIITGLQDDTGIISNAASTGLTMAALSAIGINPAEIIKGEKTVIDGLLTQVSNTFDGFKPTTNTFSTEQGFRGLLAWQILENDGDYRVYDFAEFPYEPAYETPDTCTVSFDITPEDAVVTVDGFTADENGKFLLPLGEYEYKAKKSGYKTKSEDFIITDEDISQDTEKIISVTLKKRSGGGISSSKIRIGVKVMIHNDDCENNFTYKNNSSEFEGLVSGTAVLDSGATVYDATTNVLDSEGIDYTEEEGYFSQIDGISEFDHGDYSGWMFMVDGEHSKKGSSETKLTENSSIIWYYTDDYRLERGSAEFDEGEEDDLPSTPRFGLLGKNEDIVYKEIVAPGKTFDDITEHESKAEIEALCVRGIINGKTETEYDPEATMTRAEFATIVVNALGLPEKNGVKFDDVKNDDWFSKYIETAYYYGIVKGVSVTTFNPQGTITLEEAAAMMLRAAKLCGMNTDINILTAKNVIERYEDANEVSAWAYPGLGFCIYEGIVEADDEKLASGRTVTRGQIAEMIYRMMEKAKLI